MGKEVEIMTPEEILESIARSSFPRAIVKNDETIAKPMGIKIDKESKSIEYAFDTEARIDAPTGYGQYLAEAHRGMKLTLKQEGENFSIDPRPAGNYTHELFDQHGDRLETLESKFMPTENWTNRISHQVMMDSFAEIMR